MLNFCQIGNPESEDVIKEKTHAGRTIGPPLNLEQTTHQQFNSRYQSFPDRERERERRKRHFGRSVIVVMAPKKRMTSKRGGTVGGGFIYAPSFKCCHNTIVIVFLFSEY